MKTVIALITIFFLFNSKGHAFEAKVEIKPKRPVVNESFQIIFHITSEKQAQPHISFNHGDLEVSKPHVSRGMEATLIQGRFATNINYAFVYEANAPTAKTHMLTNMVVTIDGEKKRISNRLISVLKEPERAKSYFIEAQVPKETIYIGEGIDVQYFVYSKGRILSSELQVYPKLNNFIKRFIDVSKTPSEKVSYKGEIYDRHLIYAARVYPEKTGRLYLDPVKMKLTGMFGSASIFGMGQARTLSLSSQSIQIQVMPLPADGVPTNFTGLVGDHDMIFKLNKSKFVVNEIIEGNLEVNGEGLLEKFEAPVLYQHNALEKFDTRSEIIKIDKTTVKKVFDYTFIPRSGLLLEGRSFSLSFFDPEEKRYYEKSFDLPEISVSGEASQNKQQETARDDGEPSRDGSK